MENNMVKNPIWKAVNQLAILPAWPRIWNQGLPRTNPRTKSLGTFLSKSILNYSTVLSLSLKIYYDYINTSQKISNCASYKIMKN